MAFSRYRNAPLIDYAKQYGTSRAISRIRALIASGNIKVKQVLLKEGERLDTIAGTTYGDGRYWWVLAAASDIGWGMQVPPGTVINIPDIKDINAIV